MSLALDYSTIRKVGGHADLTPSEAAVLAVLVTWKSGRDGWSHGTRAAVHTVTRLSECTVTRALAGLEAKGFLLGRGRWKFGIAVVVASGLLRFAAAAALRALLEAKRTRQRMRAVRGQIGAMCREVLQKCQCDHGARTLTDHQKIRDKGQPKVAPRDLSEQPSVASALDRAISDGLKARAMG